MVGKPKTPAHIKHTHTNVIYETVYFKNCILLINCVLINLNDNNQLTVNTNNQIIDCNLFRGC